MRLIAAVLAICLFSTGAATAGPATTATAPPAAAAKTPAPPPPAPPIDSLTGVQPALAALLSQAENTSDDGRLAAIEGQLGALQARAQAAVTAHQDNLAAINIALKPPPTTARRRATATEKAKLAALEAQRPVQMAALAQAQTVAASASAAFNQVAERRREGFSARLLQRSASPLEPSFWASLAESTDADLGRVLAALREETEVVSAAPEPQGLGGLALGLACALLLLFPARRWLEKLGRHKTGKAVHPGFGRTGAALWVALVDTGLPTLASGGLHLSAQWGGLLSPKADALADAAVGAVAWAFAILSLGRVLATDPEYGHRLLELPDDAARRLRPPLIAVAVVTATGFLFTRLDYLVGASVAATIAANCMLSLAYAAVAGLILVTFGRSRLSRTPTEPGVQSETPAPLPRSPAWTLTSLVLTTAIIITLGAVIAGYTTLAALTSGQIFWLSLIAAATYLLTRFADDLCGQLFGPKGWASRTLLVLFNLRRSTISQAGLLVSAGLQLILLISALSLALTPFGRGGDLLLAHLSRLGGDIKFGSAVISPTAVAAGLATFIIGMGLVHAVQRWIDRRYLPLTDWDPGVRNSVSTGVGYLGVGLALICGFTAMGLGFKQIALIASALSVGIGFGLQQVVQNFVSGVILLVERPVKVGDWISVDGVEGDIRRIRVRATEVRTFDRSTVIIPNSDLITKSVQNKTLGDPRGRLQLQLSIGDPADAERAQQVILDLAGAHVAVLKDPPPAVYIDSLAAGGGVNFNCYFYVASPRDAYKTRSQLYFQVLKAFQIEKIGFNGAGPQNMVVEPGEAMRALFSQRAAPRSASGGDGRAKDPEAQPVPAARR